MRFGHRLAGARGGEPSVRLDAQAVRGVAFGFVVTALVFSVAGGIGLAVAGIPFAAVLTAVMLGSAFMKPPVKTIVVAAVLVGLLVAESQAAELESGISGWVL